MSDIKCHDGKCIDRYSIDTRFRSMFNSKNIIDQIEKDLLEDSIGRY